MIHNLTQSWRRFSKQSGLALIFTLGMILSAGAAPADSSRLETLSSMMVALQVVAETYAVDHEGRYAKDLETLYTEAIRQKYWVDTVKYTRRHPGGPEVEVKVPLRPVLYLDAKAQAAVSGISTLPSQPAEAVIYLRMLGDSEYCIFALDGQGGLLKDAKGRDFYLANRDNASLCRLP